MQITAWICKAAKFFWRCLELSSSTDNNGSTNALIRRATIKNSRASLFFTCVVYTACMRITDTCTCICESHQIEIIISDWCDSERANGLFSKCLCFFLRHNEEKIESICQRSHKWRMKNNFLKDVSVSFPSPRWESRISDSYGILQMADASNIEATPGLAPRQIPGCWFIDASPRVNCGAQVSITLLGCF